MTFLLWPNIFNKALLQDTQLIPTDDEDQWEPGSGQIQESSRTPNFEAASVLELHQERQTEARDLAALPNPDGKSPYGLNDWTCINFFARKILTAIQEA